MQLQHNKNAALYCRLSRDDGNVSESDSIQNQEMMLTRYAKEKGFQIVDIYKDDGWSGTSFDRPDFVRMMGDLRTKKADTVIVKDFSRFGREHIQADLYREIEFPQMGVRLIAVGDSYDSAGVDRSANSMAQIKGLFNEWFAAETSEKVRHVLRSKKEAGQYVSKVPYGYKRNPNDRHKLIIDMEAAVIVERIFDMMIAGNGYDRIAKTLSNEKVLTPTAYAGGASRSDCHTPCDWHYTAVRTILSNPTYLGHTVQGRYTSVSFKVKKAVKVPENQWIWVENTHEPIISGQVWDMAQGIMHKRKRSVKNGEPHIFAGLLRCSDCGNTLAKNAKDIFSCWQYKTKGKEHCTNHHITLEKLTAAVLSSIWEVSAEVRDNRDAFIGRLSGIGEKRKRQKTDAARKERDKISKRLAEIPGLIKKAFEQNAAGKLPDDIYAEMMNGYTLEREDLTAKLDTLTATIDEADQESADINEFMGLIERYIDIQELDRAIVHELIEKLLSTKRKSSMDNERNRLIFIIALLEKYNNVFSSIRPPAMQVRMRIKGRKKRQTMK